MAKTDHHQTKFNALAQPVLADINGANSGKQTPPGIPNSPPGGVSVLSYLLLTRSFYRSKTGYSYANKKVCVLLEPEVKRPLTMHIRSDHGR